MPPKAIKFIDKQPAPSSELSKNYTYFQLGCGACEHSVCLQVLGKPRAERVHELVSDVRPRTETHQRIAYSDANVTCLDRATGQITCQAAEQIQTALEQINNTFTKG
jgi:hypothetical protein